MHAPQATPDPRKVHLISLGCARNKVDSEVMLGTLLGEGWGHTTEPEEASAIIVNTCGFIESAKTESIDTILEASEYKKTNKDLKLIVTGCLTQRYKTQLAKGLPEVDFFVGTDEFSRIAELIDAKDRSERVFAKRTNYLYNENLPRINTLAKSSAYVKVAEGCQHQCSFCIIPAIRGKLRSRPIPSVVSEVKALVADGVLEVNLIAQDLAAYGRDRGASELLDLLRELVKIEELKWIRLLYVYPEEINDEFLEFFANEPKIVKYLDIPAQHGSDKILRAMKRQITRNGLLSLIKTLRTRIPEMMIRTSVMVGFPGETEAEFSELLSFVKEAAFDQLGCFTYSQEEGTLAGRMPGQVDEPTKVERQKLVMDLQKDISAARLKSFVGQTLEVLVLGESEESEHLWSGRFYGQAPEVDGNVFITDGELKKDIVAKVIIEESHDYDLVGKIISI